MKKIKLIFFVLSLSLNFNAQMALDTIDYSVINRKQLYKLNKVTSGKSNVVMSLNPGFGYTHFIFDTTQIRSLKPIFLGKKIKIRSNDTLLYLEFDLERGTKLYSLHQWGVMHLNIKSGIIILDKINTFNNYVKRSFKIIKLTKSEMVLKDISNQDLNRIYYLIKQ